MDKKNNKKIQEVLGKLNQRERAIIKMRFGIDDNKTHTLEEVGKEFKITRERVRQIEAKVLEIAVILRNTKAESKIIIKK